MKTTANFINLLARTTSILIVLLFCALTPQPSYSQGLQSVNGHVADSNNNSSETQNSSQNSSANGSRLRFIPPTDSAPRKSNGSGSRGWYEQLPRELVTLLIPSQKVAAQTISGHPRFLWYLSEPVDVPIVFTLVDTVENQTIFEKRIDSGQVGMISVELPENSPELIANPPGLEEENRKIYMWSVTLECDRENPPKTSYYRSWIERVSPPPELEQKLAAVAANTNSSTSELLHQQAIIYAEAGAWFDALDALYQAQAANPNDSSIRADFIALLEQVGLGRVVQ
ncbi:MULTISPECIES: DUF928 domain-containing protein [Moorena]|uniref:DUF928 domain-containing protein n=1 Tax=Moorena producens 3L TaxID=489825 RepID=F4XNF8_9CYAN|nr:MULTISPECIES: DUF928 domain-containing protein [Moorena]EGJ34217.1 protein of unknown function, DUF928 [Moorena producens 3L]NEP33211.1 DUF928 domain-containing protein [Moorena sp. SIO3B2]NEP68828.1 DUF928 domain-containing protein [Moorena sp. SIO3A5]NEQ09941.1 DUF928 domain-containing protein [Moorena sp. SIO4E2]NER90747.1 DUF928 domain-containing protein [Moorena sp. SIO3A2]